MTESIIYVSFFLRAWFSRSCSVLQFGLWKQKGPHLKTYSSFVTEVRNKLSQCKSIKLLHNNCHLVLFYFISSQTIISNSVVSNDAMYHSPTENKLI